MSDAVLTTLIETLPAILWVAFAVVVLLVLRHPLIQQLSRLRTAATPFGSFDFEVASELVDRVAESRPDVKSSASSRRAVATRLEHATPFLNGGRILWVDDEPEGNRALIDLFERAGMTIRTARSTTEAGTELDHASFDLIITDMSRGNDSTAGIELVERWGDQFPIILYAMRFDPRKGVPAKLFAYTTSFDEVINFVVDVMERLRFGADPTSRVIG
jgi:CheY-like chemotaxis protein